MNIISLEKQKKHLTQVIFDDESCILLDNDIIENFKISIGDDFDGQQIEKLSFESNYTRAKSRALWYLDRLDHTQKMLYQKLIRAGFEKGACTAVIQRLMEVGLVNDERFAENYAAKCVENNISSRDAVFKMMAKGVSRDVAKQAIDRLETNEEDQITELLSKKYSTKLQSVNGVQKVYAALIRKGFSFSAVKNVLKKYSEELEYSEE